LSTKITGTITSTVTMGSGLFLSPLTVTGTGFVDPSAYGAVGIYLPGGQTRTTTLVNDGRVFGGNGAYSQNDGGNGGIGVGALSGIRLVNAGTIGGGNGGNSGGEAGNYNGGGGLDAVFVETSLASSISNTGLMIGGAGGAGQGDGGFGGGGLVAIGVSIAISNAGIMRGGAGGAGYFYRGGIGGFGAVVEIGTMLNTGTITGGAGGSSYADNGGTGGSGAIVYDAVFTNTGVITGGGGGNSNNLHGGQGGYGVNMRFGGTLINAGTIGGGAGGYAYYYHTHGAAGGAVLITSTYAGTVVAEAGAVFNGAVVATTLAADVLEVAGTTGVVLTGIGTQFTNFSEIAFAQGATRGIEGNLAGLASGQTISGFGAGDTIVLDGFEAVAGVDKYSGLLLVPLSSTDANVADLGLGGSLTGDIIGHFANGNTTITSTASTDGIVLKSGFENVTKDGVATAVTIGANASMIVEYGGQAKNLVINSGSLGGFDGQFGLGVEAGGTVANTVLDSGSRAAETGGLMINTLIKTDALLEVVAGGVASDTTIAGGTMFIEGPASSPSEPAGTASGAIDFSGKGGTLVVALPPTVVISGFAAGDSIEFFNTLYATGDKVSVKKAGVVTVTLNGVSVDLKVAGAKKGETDFKLAEGIYGATLTKKSTAAAMSFLTPPVEVASGGTALPALELGAVSQQKSLPSGNFLAASAPPQAGALQDLLRVSHGGVETLVTLQGGW